MTTPQEAAMRRALEYAEAQCRGRCNAEYNPCHAYEIADCLRTALAQQELPQKERPDFMAGYDAGMADAKRMAQQGEQAKPAAYITDTHQGPMVWTPEMYGEACTYCDDGEFPVPLYTAAPAPQTQEPVLGTKTWFDGEKLITQNLTASDIYAEPANSYDLAKRADNGGQP